MKAKSDEKSTKGKEDERKRATEKHKYILWEVNKKVIKMENSKKGRHLEKLQKWSFFKNQMVSKKRGDTELQCKTGVKHISKFKKIHFQKLSFICCRRRKWTKGIKKNWNFNTKVFFLFEKVEKYETVDAKGDPKKKREDTKQFEPDGNGSRKTCSKKIKQEEREKTQREQSEKRKKGDEQMKKHAKKKTKNQSRWARSFFFKKKKERGRKEEEQQSDLFSKKKCKKKERKKNDFFRKERKLFFTKQFNQVDRVRNISSRNFPLQKKSSKKKLFPDFSFLVKNIWQRKKTGDEKGGMNEKEGEAEKKQSFQVICFWTKKTRKQRREICKTIFSWMWVRGSENKKQKENNRDKQPKGWKKRQIKKHPNKGLSSKTIGERKKKPRKTRFAKLTKRRKHRKTKPKDGTYGK